jgi:hypothetical protein
MRSIVALLVIIFCAAHADETAADGDSDLVLKTAALLKQCANDYALCFQQAEKLLMEQLNNKNEDGDSDTQQLQNQMEVCADIYRQCERIAWAASRPDGPRGLLGSWLGDQDNATLCIQSIEEDGRITGWYKPGPEGVEAAAAQHVQPRQRMAAGTYSLTESDAQPTAFGFTLEPVRGGGEGDSDLTTVSTTGELAPHGGALRTSWMTTVMAAPYYNTVKTIRVEAKSWTPLADTC